WPTISPTFVEGVGRPLTPTVIYPGSGASFVITFGVPGNVSGSVVQEITVTSTIPGPDGKPWFPPGITQHFFEAWHWDAEEQSWDFKPLDNFEITGLGNRPPGSFGTITISGKPVWMPGWTSHTGPDTYRDGWGRFTVPQSNGVPASTDPKPPAGWVDPGKPTHVLTITVSPKGDITIQRVPPCDKPQPD